VDKGFCGHTHIDTHLDDYASVLEAANFQTASVATQEILKSLFRVSPILKDGCWPAITQYPTQKTYTEFRHKPLKATFLREVFQKIVGLRSVAACPPAANDIHMPCSPALAFLLSLRRLVNDLLVAQVLDDTKPSAIMWSKGAGHIRIPIKALDDAEGTPLHREWAKKIESGRPEGGGICSAIWDVTRARVPLGNLPNSENERREPLPLLELFDTGSAEPVCAVLLNPRAIHFYWAGPST
jgi:hypothetical protein